METITFYAYKGGTGRSLTVANFAKYLALLSYNVVVVDLDLEAPGLHYKFAGPSAEKLPVSVGLIDYVWARANHTEDVSAVDLLVDVPVAPGSQGTIRLVPAGRVPSSEYWQKLRELDWHGLFYSGSGMGVPIFLNFQEEIREVVKPDFLLIDSRTGITQMGEIATALLPDKLVCLMLNNLETLEGSRAVLRAVHRQGNAVVDRPVSLFPVLARIPEEGTPDAEVLGKTLVDYLNQPAEELDSTLHLQRVFVFHSDPLLQVEERLHVGTSSSGDLAGTLHKDYLRLFNRLVPHERTLSHITNLIAPLRERFFDDPDGVQKTLEDLCATISHLELYRELLRIYKARGIEGKPALTAAYELWSLNGDAADELVQRAVNSAVQRPESWPVQSYDNFLHFLGETWRAGGSKDVGLAVGIARMYLELNAAEPAARLMRELINNLDNPTAEVIGLAVQAHRLANDSIGAVSILESHTGYMNELPVLTEWAELELASAEGPSKALLDSLESLIVSEPHLAYRILIRGMAPKEAQGLLQKIMQRLRGVPTSQLASVGALANQLELGHEFERMVRAKYPDGHAESIMSRASLLAEQMRRRTRRRTQEGLFD